MHGHAAARCLQSRCTSRGPVPLTSGMLGLLYGAVAMCAPPGHEVLSGAIWGAPAIMGGPTLLLSGCAEVPAVRSVSGSPGACQCRAVRRSSHHSNCSRLAGQSSCSLRSGRWSRSGTTCWHDMPQQRAPGSPGHHASEAATHAARLDACVQAVYMHMHASKGRPQAACHSVRPPSG